MSEKNQVIVETGVSAEEVYQRIIPYKPDLEMNKNWSKKYDWCVYSCPECGAPLFVSGLPIVGNPYIDSCPACQAELDWTDALNFGVASGTLAYKMEAPEPHKEDKQ